MTYSHLWFIVIMTPDSKSLSSNTDPLGPRSAPGRRQRRSADIRERLFRAALNLFAQKGFAETTVEDITESADVGKGTFFNYFPSKDHILLAFVEMQLGKLEAAIETAFNLLWTGLAPRGSPTPLPPVPLFTSGD